MSSPNLAITHVAAAQNQKEVTINDAIDALDLAMTAALDLDVTAGGTLLVTPTDMRRNVSLALTGAPAADFTLQLPAVQKLVLVQNTTGQAAAVTGPLGGTGIAVPAGQRHLLYATGSAVLPIDATLGASGVVPGVYGDGDNVPRITVDAQGRITSLTTLPVAGGGGGSGAAYCAGATGGTGGGSTTAFATKGLLFVPDTQIMVSHVWGSVAAIAVGQDHHARIAEISGPSAVDTITAVLATSATVQTISTDLRLYRYPFAAPVLLEPGKTYLLATVNAAGTGTTANRTGTINSGANSGWDLNAPGQTLWGTAQFDTIGLATGQAPAGLGTGKYCIALEGAVV
jgi:hypothetical protein